MRKTFFMFVISLFVIFNIVSLVDGYGVVSRYWDENPLIMAPGESKEVVITLQSIPSEDDMNIRAEILEGLEIIELIDEAFEYFLPSGGEAKVNLRVSVPKRIFNSEYPIIVKFTQVSGFGKGMVSFGLSYKKSFKVLVIGEPKETALEKIGILRIILIVLIIVVMGIIYFIWRSYRRKNMLMQNNQENR